MTEMTPEERAKSGRITRVLRILNVGNTSNNRAILRYHFRAIVQAEREACEAVAESYGDSEIAAAIRARGKEEG